MPPNPNSKYWGSYITDLEPWYVDAMVAWTQSSGMVVVNDVMNTWTYGRSGLDAWMLC